MRLVQQLKRWLGGGTAKDAQRVVALRSDGPCAVCLDDLGKGGGELRQLVCTHKFHAHCIAMWLRRSSFCPLCRQDSGEGPILHAQRQELWSRIDNFLLRNEELLMSWTVGWAAGSTCAATPLFLPFSLTRKHQKVFVAVALLLRAFSLFLYYPDAALLRAVKRNAVTFACGFLMGLAVSTLLWRRLPALVASSARRRRSEN